MLPNYAFFVSIQFLSDKCFITEKNIDQYNIK